MHYIYIRFRNEFKPLFLVHTLHTQSKVHSAGDTKLPNSFFFLSDEGDEEELLLPPDDEIDPLIDSSAYSTNNFIQTAEDIDDIDIEENVDYITGYSLPDQHILDTN